jgi:glutathione S-transferase
LLWIGPTQAQANFFYRFAEERYAFPTQRFIGETERLYGILNARLANRDYLAGSDRGRYSIADIAVWPFVNAIAVAGIELEEMFPHVYQWWSRISDRPAVQKGTTIPSGQEFAFGYKQLKQKAKDDPEGTEAQERPLREALEKAKKEFGYEYESP